MFTPLPPEQYGPPPVTGKTAGADNTVAKVDVAQPAGSVYDIVVVPGAVAFTTPDGLMVATDELELAHVPPAAVSVSIGVAYWQKVLVAGNGDGVGFTVTTAVARAPQGLETV
jgi:S1-C subfamily serine protease